MKLTTNRCQVWILTVQRPAARGLHDAVRTTHRTHSCRAQRTITAAPRPNYHVTAPIIQNDGLHAAQLSLQPTRRVRLRQRLAVQERPVSDDERALTDTHTDILGSVPQILKGNDAAQPRNRQRAHVNLCSARRSNQVKTNQNFAAFRKCDHLPAVPRKYKRLIKDERIVANHRDANTKYAYRTKQAMTNQMNSSVGKRMLPRYTTFT
jgi:hypothetical protein